MRAIAVAIALPTFWASCHPPPPWSAERVEARSKLCASLCAERETPDGWQWWKNGSGYTCVCSDGFATPVP